MERSGGWSAGWRWQAAGGGGASPRAEAGLGVQCLRGLEVCGLDQLEQQVEGVSVSPPRHVQARGAQKHTSTHLDSRLG